MMSATTQPSSLIEGQSQQWLRFCRLRAGPKAGGEGIDLSQLRISFRVNSMIVSTPNTLVARVYNLADPTVAQLLAFNPTPVRGEAAQLDTGRLQRASGQVILDAGYINGQQGNIFTGSIVQVQAGRESQTDTYVDIYAQDGDGVHNKAIMNTTIPAGYTPEDINAALAKSLAPFDVSKGELPDTIEFTKSSRGKVLFGMSRDYHDDLARTYEMTWSVDRGKIVYIPYTRFRAEGGDAIELNSKTGLVGTPVLTEQGVKIQCLLNPLITWGTRVHINNRILTQNSPSGASITPPTQNLEWTAYNYFPGTDADGFYKALLVDHVGDTRGNEWYTNITALSLDSTQLPMQSVGIGIPP